MSTEAQQVPTEAPPAPTDAAPKKKGKGPKPVKKNAQVPIHGGAAKGKKGDDSKELIGITAKKDSDFSQWYQEVVIKAEMIEYYNEISGFYILRPAAMYVWNEIRNWFQKEIQELGVEETSFPMFLSAKSLEKEKEHVEGFAPELAWVTKAGDKDLEVPVAVRPTSEAVMYPYYAKWVRFYW